MDPHRRVSALVGRGGGKTTAWKARALIRLVTTGRARLRYIALSRPDAEELLWEPLKFTIEELSRTFPSLEIGKDVFFNETKLRLTLARTGGELQLVGADDKKEVQKLRGKPFHEVGLDEAASHDDRRVADLLYRAVGPRLGDYRGAFVMFGTPGHILQGEFFKSTCPGGLIEGVRYHRPYEERNNPEFADWTGWSSHAWALTDPDAQKIPQLANVWSEAQITKRDQQWSDDNPIWRREYLGLWAADDTENIYRYRAIVDGKLWNQWDPKRDPTTGFAILPGDFKDWHYAYGADMGSKDPFALNVFAFSPSDTTRTLYHVYSFGKTAMYAKLIATLLVGDEAVTKILRGEQVDYEKSGGLFAATGWPAAFVADLAHLGEAVIDELANVYGIRIKAAEKKGKHATIEGANGDLVDGRIKVLKDSELERQLSSLQWRKDEFDQVKEGKGDRNDHCFVAGTIVVTEAGLRPIETVQAGDRVWTRAGLRTVVAAGLTGERETWRAVFSDGRSLVGTGNHPVWTSDGWIPLQSLTPSCTFVEWRTNMDHPFPSYGEGSRIGGIRNPRFQRIASTTAQPTDGVSIATSGPTTADPSPMDSTSITRTEIHSTIALRIFSPSTVVSTRASTCASPRPSLAAERVSVQPSQPHPHGMAPKRGSNGIVRTALGLGELGQLSCGHAPCAATRSRRNGNEPRFAALNAMQRSEDRAGSTTLIRPASGAVAPFGETSTHAQSAARLRVASVTPTGNVEPVYNLTVEGEPEFFANGVLVHNCDSFIYVRRAIVDLFASGVVVANNKPEKPVYVDPQNLGGDDAGEYDSMMSDVDFEQIDYGG